MKFQKPRRWVFDCCHLWREIDILGVRLCLLKEKKTIKETLWLPTSQKFIVKQR
jgi:hypothetical protein